MSKKGEEAQNVRIKHKILGWTGKLNWEEGSSRRCLRRWIRGGGSHTLVHLSTVWEKRVSCLRFEREKLYTNKPGYGYKGISLSIRQDYRKQEKSGMKSEWETTLKKCVHAVG